MLALLPLGIFDAINGHSVSAGTRTRPELAPVIVDLLGVTIDFKWRLQAKSFVDSEVVREKRGFGKLTANSRAEPALAEMLCRLNRSMQHWLEVYSPEFQSPKFSAGVD